MKVPPLHDVLAIFNSVIVFVVLIYSPPRTPTPHPHDLVSHASCARLCILVCACVASRMNVALTFDYWSLDPSLPTV